MKNIEVLHIGSNFINMIKTITNERIEVKKKNKQNKL